MLRTLPLGRVTFNSPRFRAMRKKATPTVKKAKQDRAQALAVEKHVRMIRVAMRGGDEAEISRLCKQATKAGVSSAVIDRALERSRTRDSLQELLYEGTLPGGVCVLIEILTDNPKRTAPQVRHELSDGGGSLGAAGCAMWAFTRRALLEFQPEAGRGGAARMRAWY